MVFHHVVSFAADLKLEMDVKWKSTYADERDAIKSPCEETDDVHA
jgi:hypothetical protein